MQIMLSFKVVSRVFVFVIYRHKFHNVKRPLKKIKAARFGCLLNVISCISSSSAFNDTCKDRWDGNVKKYNYFSVFFSNKIFYWG